MMKLKGLSLFSNVGIAEIFFEKIGIDILIANEIVDTRAKFYKENYPNTDVIIGDIKKKKFFDEIINKSKKNKIDFIITTPPCQGMSNAGKKDKKDPRNTLINEAIKVIREIKPKYVFLENVPQQLNTFVRYNNEEILIPNYLRSCLKKYYNFSSNETVNAAHYSVPQNRTRSIILLTRKDLKNTWNPPKRHKKIITLKDAIGNLPKLDPLIYDIPYKKHLEIFPKYEKRLNQASLISKWHKPPKHVFRQVISMMNTPTGKSAFENINRYKPKKINGDFVKGFKNTYKRQNWNTPGYTVTTFNRTIGSQENVHPGRKIDNSEIYSDPRVLTVYEIMKIMTIPTRWKIPEWCTENFLRTVIGEGIPPLLVKFFFEELIKIDKKNERKN
tara:strand:+ start:249 stop:1409 length:1161 start_codon:yes stop_codon:yes gene_type:complete